MVYHNSPLFFSPFNCFKDFTPNFDQVHSLLETKLLELKLIIYCLLMYENEILQKKLNIN